jgi:hypothetical protein
VKLLHLFLNNPGKSFYVREITRLIDEQINSVRRELANMMSVGVVTSDTSDNKLYYEVNQRYEFYVPLRAIFADEKVTATQKTSQPKDRAWHAELRELPGAKIIVLGGVLVKGSASSVDVLVAGDVNETRFKKIIKQAETTEGRELNYVRLSYEDFYYRLSVRDKFVTEIITGKYITLVDENNILSAAE